MKFGEDITIADALLISVVSIVVVFLTLLVISFLIDIIAKIVNHKKPGAGKGTEGATVAKTETAQDLTESSGAEEELDTDEETLLLLAAAIGAYLELEPDQYKIVSVKRIPTEETPWESESRREALQ